MSRRRYQRHRHAVGVRVAAQDHAAQRAHVGEVAAPGDDDMVFLGHQVVGRVELDPAGRLAAPHRDPGVAGVGAAQRDLLLGVDRADVARDVAGGEAVGAQGRDLDMGEVLADACLAGEDLAERGADVGRVRVILEIRLDARRELARRREDRPAGRQRLGAVVPERLDAGHQRRVVDELARLDRLREAAAVQGIADLLPRRRVDGRRRIGKANVDAARTSISKRLCGLSMR